MTLETDIAGRALPNGIGSRTQGKEGTQNAQKRRYEGFFVPFEFCLVPFVYGSHFVGQSCRTQLRRRLLIPIRYCARIECRQVSLQLLQRIHV